MDRNTKRLMAAIATLAACGAASGAGAATANAQFSAGEQDSANPGGTLDEIVVTANRREQRLQDVPIAVTAMTGESIQRRGLNNTEALTAGTPGLVFNRQANAATPFIRGVGNQSAAVGQEATVATYVDDVYIAAPFANLFSFNNIERVEVLKGPQGTLFGRNATGGVIQIITRTPSSKPMLEASVGYGNYDTLSGSLYASTGLTESLAADIAIVASDQRDGWGRSLTTGQDAFLEKSFSARSKISWDIGPSTSLLLIADYSYLKSQTGVNYHLTPGSVGVGGVVYGGFYNHFGAPQDFIVTRQRGVSAKLTHDFGALRFVSISSYRRVMPKLRIDLDAGPAVISGADLSQLQSTYTQEFQLLSSADSKIQWMTGLYYLHDYAAYRPLTLGGSSFGPLPITIFAHQKTNSYSAFAQATTEVFDQTNLTLGVRYTVDERSVGGRTLVAGTEVGSGGQKDRFPKLTWRAALDHHFSDDFLGYASYTRGFKSGIYNTISYADPAVRPEVVDAFEVGFKSELFNRRVRINAAAFYYDYKDIQLNKVQLVTLLLNAAKATIKGVDVDFAINPVEGLTFSGGASMLDGTYKDFRDAPYQIPDPSGAGGNITASSVATCPPGSPFTGGGCDASGNRTVRSPKLTFNLAVDYRYRLSEGTIDANVNFYHNSGFAWDPDNRLRQRSYNLVNGSTGWTSETEKWRARLWVQNLFDKKYNSFVIAEGGGDHASPAPPRTFGVTVGVKLQ